VSDSGNVVIRKSFILFAVVCLTVMAVLYAATHKREFTRSDKALVAEYMSTEPVRRLQVGAGSHNLPGWLNSDIEPIAGQFYLDVTERFPFDDGTLHYIYAEQLIEHLPYEKSVFFLKESHRVLASGGKIRLATPNLSRLLALFNPTKTPIQQHLLDYQIQRYKLSSTPLPETVTLNLFFREWGHQFLYDPQSLRATLEHAGFMSVAEFELGISDDKNLSGIEMHWKDGGKELDQYTSMYFEAMRP
jgi:predicted SAM-dependent methyltransferase